MNKTILLDARAIDALPFGVGCYAREMTERLPLLRPDWRWIVLRCGAELSEQAQGNMLTIRAPAAFSDYPVEQRVLANLFRNRPLDLAHALWYPTAEALACPRIITVQDMIVFKGHRDFSNDHFWNLLPWFRRSIQIADHVIVPSMASFRDVVDLVPCAPEQLTVIPLACSRHFRPAAPQRLDIARKQYGLPRQYIFCSTHYNRTYKNAGVVHEALRLLREQGLPPPTLVSTGDDHQPTPNWLRLGMLNEEDLASVLSGALFMIYPSRAEGFGLPLLEAMQCGVPVVSSTADSLPEVGGSAPLYFNPDRPHELAASIKALLGSAKLRACMRDQGLRQVQRFSWETCARKTVALYEQALADTPKREPGPPVDWHAIVRARVLPPAAVAEDTPDHSLQKARHLLDNHNPVQALAILEQEDRARTDNPDVLREMGKIHKQAQRWHEAHTCFERMLQRARKLGDPAHRRSASFHLGECAMQLAQLEQAQTLFQECLDICPNHDMAAVRLRDVRMAIGNKQNDTQNRQ